MDKKVPFCWNTRRWLDFCFTGSPRSCPYREQGNNNCVYEKCGYFENRIPSKRYKRNMKILRSFCGKDEKVKGVPNREIIKCSFLNGIKKRGLDDWLNEMVAHWENWEIYKQKVKNVLEEKEQTDG